MAEDTLDAGLDVGFDPGSAALRVNTPSAERTRSLLGARIEEWTLEEVLGVGVRTAVYLARSENDVRVVIRMLHQEYDHDARVRSAVLREAWMGSELFHPARVRTISVGHHEGRTLYLAQEHVAGMPLDLLMLRDGALDLETAIRVVDTALQVVQSYHQRDVAHGALSPSKIIVEASGAIRVLHCSEDDGTPTNEPLAVAMARDVSSCGLLLASVLSGRSLSTSPNRDWLAQLVHYVASESAGESATGRDSLLVARLGELFQRTLFASPTPFADPAAARAHLEAMYDDRLLSKAFLEEWTSPRRVPVHSEVVPRDLEIGDARRSEPSWGELIDDDEKDVG